MSQDKPAKNLKINRRDALKYFGAGAAATLTPGLPSNPSVAPVESHRADVIVIGAGFAGLTAARNLERAGKKVVVLEAQDRIGGRIKAATLAGRKIDVGGMWVGPTQTRALALIKEFGLHLVPQYEDGKSVSLINGKRANPERESLGFDPKTQAEYERLVNELNKLTDQVPLDAPWDMPHAEELDSITLED